MVYHTCQLLLHDRPDFYFACFVFFGTICSYSFHWYLTTPDANSFSDRMLWLSRNKKIHQVLFVIGVFGSVVSGLFLLEFWKWLLLAGFITFLYSAPKVPYTYFKQLQKVALGKTILLAVVWTYVTSVLPLIMSRQPWQSSFTLFAASRYLFIYAICILFDYRDREYDRIHGIRSLITWLDNRGINYLFIASLLGFAVFTLALVQHGLPWLSILIQLIPAVIAAALYSYAQRNFSDFLYYFILDGLMALPAIFALTIDR
jgi:4-hydroxybenzoate polyprenyltransferase